MPKTCFVISPIGEPGSPAREAADDLLDLLVLPALSRFDFDVVRADKIPRPGVITNDIVELIQTAELCIIDLTGHNPNVYYECGRRHETGKPFIQLIRRGETLPFDVAGIRTINYDLSSARTAHECVGEIQSYVAVVEGAGYGPRQSGASIAALSQAIDRLERKVDRIATPVTASTPSSTAEFMLEHPRRGVLKAMSEGRPDTVAILLPRLREIQGLTPEIIFPAGMAARAGYDVGVSVLLDAIDEIAPQLDDDQFKLAVASLVDHYSVNDREAEGIDRLATPILDRATSHELENPKESAYLLNQLQKLYYGAESFEEAQRYGVRAAELNPTESAYWYNLSLIYQQRGLMELAEEAIRKVLELKEGERHDEDQLVQAVEIFAARARTEEARGAFHALTAINPGRAQMLVRTDPDVRSALQE